MLFSVSERERRLSGVRQLRVHVESEDCKFDTLCELWKAISPSTCALVYCNTQGTVDWLVDRVQHVGLASVSSTRNTWSQVEQRDALHKHLGSHTQMLVSSIPVDPTTAMFHRIVINYDAPSQSDVYLQSQLPLGPQ